MYDNGKIYVKSTDDSIVNSEPEVDYNKSTISHQIQISIVNLSCEFQWFDRYTLETQLQ